LRFLNWEMKPQQTITGIDWQAMFLFFFVRSSVAGVVVFCFWLRLWCFSFLLLLPLPPHDVMIPYPYFAPENNTSVSHNPPSRPSRGHGPRLGHRIVSNTQPEGTCRQGL